jgi:hypothetical protein
MLDLFASIPKRAKTSCYTFKVHVVPRAHPGLRGSDADANEIAGDGTTRFNELAIYLADDMAPQRLVVVARHELLHCLTWAYGVDDGDEEEHVVAQLATALIDFDTQNPKWVSWFTRAIREMKRQSK